MHHLKLMGTAAIAVLALVAFAGATTASATRLCSTNTTPCANVYPNDTTFTSHLFGGSMTFTTSGSPAGINPTMTCSTSTAGITAGSTGGGEGVAASMRLAALSFTGCTSVNPTGCGSAWTVGSLAGATGQIASAVGMNGTLAFTLPTVTYSCTLLGATTNCTFGGAGTVDTALTGGNPAIVDLANQSLATTGGFGCPTTVTWNARYQTTVPLYVTTS